MSNLNNIECAASDHRGHRPACSLSTETSVLIENLIILAGRAEASAVEGNIADRQIV